MENYYQCIIPRLNGDDIKTNFGHYRNLVKKGVAGFIVFGGELEQARKHIQMLQGESLLPLIIAADLERGLGQQLKGGTDLPPAMAIAHAVKKSRGRGAAPSLSLLRRTFNALADEALYAGINTIFAPVLDINTNPKNPIIAARAFGEDREAVSFFGCTMIDILQRHGIAACGKHFPGHGDTEVDSHIKLPVIERGLQALKKNELYPFSKAIKAGVQMIMLGHLSVPALDRSGIPVSLSAEAVTFLRGAMKYRGILITDAMNMGGIGKYSEEQASLMALKAGVDIILHPTAPDRIASFLKRRNVSSDPSRIREFRRGLPLSPAPARPDFLIHRELAVRLTERAIQVSAKPGITKPLFLLILNDEEDRRHRTFVKRFRENFPGSIVRIIDLRSGDQKIALPQDRSVIAAIFSETKGWRGGAGSGLRSWLSYLEEKTALFISFGSPYLLDGIRGAPRMSVYWDSAIAQKAAADRLLKFIAV